MAVHTVLKMFFILVFEGSQACGCTLLMCSHLLISLHHPVLSPCPVCGLSDVW